MPSQHTEQWYREWVDLMIEEEGDWFGMEDEAEVQLETDPDSEDGAWVQVWMWIPDEEV